MFLLCPRVFPRPETPQNPRMAPPLVGFWAAGSPSRVENSLFVFIGLQNRPKTPLFAPNPPTDPMVVWCVLGFMMILRFEYQRVPKLHFWPYHEILWVLSNICKPKTPKGVFWFWDPSPAAPKGGLPLGAAPQRGSFLLGGIAQLAKLNEPLSLCNLHPT